MSKIPDALINEIRNKANIVDIIGSYLPLTKKGKNYVGVCPFHDDHDPSMSVSEEKQIYHCFVCGNGGNVFTFVKEYEHISFVDSVYKVAELVNVEIDSKYKVDNKNKIKNDKNAKYYDILNDAINFNNYELGTIIGEPYLKYLYKRGIDDKIINKFQIGYNPSENKLSKFLLSKNYNVNDLVEIGVSILTTSGVKDFFNDRITIPIFDIDGNPVGFTARTINPSIDSKYINTGETKIYHKGNILFNYNNVKNSIKKSNKVIVCEGVMDVIAFERANIDYAVATLGTACTQEQLKLLKFLKSKVVLCYDGDKAGQDAIHKLGTKAISEFIDIEVVDNDTGLDPDEILNKYGQQYLIDLSNRTISFIEFEFKYLSKKYNLNNYSEKKKFTENLLELIKKIDIDYEREMYLDKLKAMTGFNFDSIEFDNKEKLNFKFDTAVRKNINTGLEKAEQYLLSIMLISSRAVDIFMEILGFLPDENYNKLAFFIVNYYRKYDKMNIASILDEIDDAEVKRILLDISENELWFSEYDDKYVYEIINKIQINIIDKEIELLQQKIQQSNDADEKLELSLKLIETRRKRGNMNGKEKIRNS